MEISNVRDRQASGIVRRREKGVGMGLKEEEGSDWARAD